MTEKLYYNDAYIKDFTATVLQVISEDNRFLTVLDKTAFFPEEGGQGADRGMIGEHAVIHVKEKGGIIYHYTETHPEVGKTYSCSINFDERYDKMKQHSSEHILSGIIKKLFGYNNVGFHVGADAVTFDTDGVISDGDLLLVETLANKVVSDNIETVAYFPSKEELMTLDYRSKLDLKENVRIVRIGDVDVCACCAPHVRRTGEIGEIKLLEWVKWKGGLRINIAAGERALKDHREKSESVKGISVLLSAPKSEVYPAVVSLKESYEDMKRRCHELEMRIAMLEADRIAPSDGDIVTYFENENMDFLVAFSNALRHKVSGITVALGGKEGNLKYVISSDRVNVGAIAREINSRLSGKGGGNSEMIRGSFATTVSEVREYFEK